MGHIRIVVRAVRVVDLLVYKFRTASWYFPPIDMR
ncbi:hypothetical protein SUDANB70_01387 [Streptomyces sp. enrichment culture]